MMADDKADDRDTETPAAAAKAAKAGRDRANGPGRNRLITGAAIGIGSAALVAALLYANRSRKSDKR